MRLIVQVQNRFARIPLRTTVGFLAALSIFIVAIASSIVVNASASESDDIVSSGHHDVKITKGPDLKTVNAALSDQALRDENNISDIAAFFKSGGRLKDGSLQPTLAYEMPLTVSKANNNDIKFQYFVDVTSDLTPASFDCSDIRLHIILDDEKEVYVTRWLGYEGRQPMLPMDTGIVSVKVFQPGHHTISFLPESRVEGCNTSDFLVSFGGTMVVYKK